MSVVVVNQWWFKEDRNLEKGMKAAGELLTYFRSQIPEVQLSLWLRDHQDPRHFFHITVFSTLEVMQKARESEGIRRFMDQLFPEIIQDESFTAPVCDVWLSSGARLEPVPLSPAESDTQSA